MTQCFADSACCDRIVLPFDLVRYSCLPSDELGEWRIFDWSPTLPYVTVLATATELLPVRGAVQLQFGCQQFTLPAPEPTVLYTAKTVRLELNT